MTPHQVRMARRKNLAMRPFYMTADRRMAGYQTYRFVNRIGRPIKSGSRKVT